MNLMWPTVIFGPKEMGYTCLHTMVTSSPREKERNTDKRPLVNFCISISPCPWKKVSEEQNPSDTKNYVIYANLFLETAILSYSHTNFF